MTSVRMKFVLVYDLPKEIYEAQRLGYDHFEADFTDDTRRLLLKFWRKSSAAKGLSLQCPGTATEECGHPPFRSRMALRWHQQAKRHGTEVPTEEESSQ